MPRMLRAVADHQGLAWDLEPSCPSCGHRGAVTFLELTGMPVFNNVLWPDRHGALHAPTGDIALAVCPACGLIANTAFEAERVAYSSAYENSLHGSGTFSTWAVDLAERLAATYDLAGGHVLEVGAGSGEFLAMLCQAGGCTGTGFDPSHDHADRRAAGVEVAAGVLTADRVTPADLVVCRHVLEHVDDPVGLLRDIAVATRTPTGQAVPLYLEVPDAGHMLRAQAFWDVIYEHPLYFDQRALRSTLARAGYRAIRGGSTFGGQFTWAEARPGRSRRPAALDGPALSELLCAADAFGRRFRQRIAEHGQALAEATVDGPVVIWGAGSKGVTFCNLVPGAAEALVVDVNPRKFGKRLPLTGQPVLAPRALADVDVSLVVVMNELYVPEIRAELRELGVTAAVVVA